MGECSRNFTSSSGYIKFATAVLIVALILHIVAFATPNWSTVRVFLSEYDSDLPWIEGSDHAGLWQICSCFEVYGGDVCSCMGRHGDPVWFKVTQTMESITLIGFIISLFISMIQLCIKQDRKLKRINIFIAIGSGLCGVLGVTVYGIRSKNDIDDIVALLDQFDMKVHGFLDFSFYICCVSVFLYVFVCAFFYMKDERIPAPTIPQEFSVVYNNQGQIIIPSGIQGASIITDIGQANAGFVPPFGQLPFCPPPAYTVDGRQEQTDLQQSQFNDGIPYKA